MQSHRAPLVDLALLSALTLGVVVARPAPARVSAPALPDQTDEEVADAPQPAHLELEMPRCDDSRIRYIVLRGHISALDADQFATFNFRFAELPSRYTVMTGREGHFEVRVPRYELGALNLCDLPRHGMRPATTFQDASFTLNYEVDYEF